MTREEGLAEIDAAQWVSDPHDGCLNLRFSTAISRIHCWLTLRPEYCDRGHIQLNINGPLGLDAQDSFPRYFFTFEEADLHCRTFLKWRIWKHRTFPHVLRAVAA